MEIVGNQDVASLTLTNGGSGYHTGDILTVQGGTGTKATAEVTELVPRAVDAITAGNSAGSGYAEDDVLTIAGGVGTKATLTVNTVDSAGGILTFTKTTSGSYTTTPSASNNAATGGTGSGATFNLTFTPAAGVIQTIEMTSPGAYTVPATPLTDNTPTGGNGTGAKLTVVVGDSNYDVAAECVYAGVTSNNDPEASYRDVPCTVKEWGE